MARYTHKQIQADPFIAEFVAFGCGNRKQKVYTMRESLQNIIGDVDLEDSIRDIFDIEPADFISLCQTRTDLDKEFYPKSV